MLRNRAVENIEAFAAVFHNRIAVRKGKEGVNGMAAAQTAWGMTVKSA